MSDIEKRDLRCPYCSGPIGAVEDQCGVELGCSRCNATWYPGDGTAWDLPNLSKLPATSGRTDPNTASTVMSLVARVQNSVWNGFDEMDRVAGEVTRQLLKMIATTRTANDSTPLGRLTTMEQNTPYPAETLGPEDDDGTMPENVDELRKAVIGHRIVSAEKGSLPDKEWDDTEYDRAGFVLTLDNGRRVLLADTYDCCAYTSLEEFLLHPDKVDHVITGVGTTDGFERWHIFADVGDVLELSVDWSPGNPFYYGYGFDIIVRDEEAV